MMYAVKAKCGHSGFGKNYFIPIIFPISALSASDAAQKVRWLPRVKHNHKDAILQVYPINLFEYKTLLLNNRRDPFLHVHSIQEQRRIIPINDMINRLQNEPTFEPEFDYYDTDDKHTFYAGKTKLRNPNKFYRYFYNEKSD